VATASRGAVLPNPLDVPRAPSVLPRMYRPQPRRPPPPPPPDFLAAFLASLSAARRPARSPGPGGAPAGVCFPAYPDTHSCEIHLSCPGAASAQGPRHLCKHRHSYLQLTTSHKSEHGTLLSAGGGVAGWRGPTSVAVCRVRASGMDALVPGKNSTHWPFLGRTSQQGR